MKILAVHREEPNWPADPNRPIYEVVHEGTNYWVETNGSSPTIDALIAVIAPPTVVPVPEVISDRQFFQQLAVIGVITNDEALAAVKTGSIPAAMQTVIDAMPSNAKFGAEMVVAGAVEFHRSHLLTAALAAAMGWTDTQVDALWTAAAVL